jgi:glycosyltransferase involved in cell wall biosynthesis
MPRQDVAIYTTSSFSPGFYDRSHGRAGGAERQMTLLARALSGRHLRVAHIVYPPRDPVSLHDGHLTLVHRGPYAGRRRVVGGALEAIRIWEALRAADGRVTIIRTASPVVGIAAIFTKLRRRGFIFSSANISDFTLEGMPGRADRALYRVGVRLADAVVVQSEDQVELARTAFPSARRVVHIPSFAEAAPSSGEGNRQDPSMFLWLGRLAGPKQPMRYVELAQAVPEARFAMIGVPEGPTPDQLDEVRSAAASVPNLELLEPLPHSDVMALVARAAAVVNTSRLEGMPNVFLEAWAHGIPVLTLEFDPDQVVERRGLGVAAGGSWERFVAGARELWEGRARREELSKRTRAYVDEAHGIDAVAARWSEVVDRVGRRS